MKTKNFKKFNLPINIYSFITFFTSFLKTLIVSKTFNDQFIYLFY